jgi:hypothetical protein
VPDEAGNTISAAAPLPADQVVRGVLGSSGSDAADFYTVTAGARPAFSGCVPPPASPPATARLAPLPPPPRPWTPPHPPATVPAGAGKITVSLGVLGRSSAATLGFVRSDLSVVVRILSSSGAVLATSAATSTAATSVSVSATVAAQGPYFISLTRTGSGNAYGTGFSAYGSAGERRRRPAPPAPWRPLRRGGGRAARPPPQDSPKTRPVRALRLAPWQAPHPRLAGPAFAANLCAALPAHNPRASTLPTCAGQYNIQASYVAVASNTKPTAPALVSVTTSKRTVAIKFTDRCACQQPQQPQQQQPFLPRCALQPSGTRGAGRPRGPGPHRTAPQPHPTPPHPPRRSFNEGRFVVQRCTGSSCTTFNNVLVVDSTTALGQGTTYTATDTLMAPGSFRYRVVACTAATACSLPSAPYTISAK